MEVIDVNRKVLSSNRETEVAEDVIVPDVKPDVISVTGVNGIAYSYKQEQTTGRVKLDGNIDAYIIYLSSNGDTRSMQTTLNFSSSLESSEIKETSILKYNIEIASIEAKVLNERKVSIVANLSVNYNFYERQQLEIYNDFDGISDLQKQEEEIAINSLIGINAVKTSLKENITVDSLDNVAEILKSDINITNIESKISYNKVLAKAEATISLVYLTEDDRISKAQGTFPVMSFIEIENVKEENICNIDYKVKNVLFKINSNEEHSITSQIEFEIMCEAYESKKVQVVSDLYSLTNDVDFEQKEIELDINGENKGYPVKVDERIEIEDVKKVIDVDSNIKILKNTVANDMSNIEGEVNLKIYYEVNSKIGLNIKTIAIPFITKMNYSESIDAKLIKCDFDVVSNEVIIQLELELKSTNCTSKRIVIIENVSVRENKVDSDYSMIVYFVKQGDTIWKIAKKFKVTMESIIKVNNLENPDLIYPGDKLYIIR